MKKTLLLLTSLFLSISICAQHQFSVRADGGISISSLINSQEYRKNVSYERTTLLGATFNAELLYSSWKKIDIRLSAGYINAGYTEKRIQGSFEPNPIHFFTKIENNYYKVGLGGQYRLTNRLSFFTGVNLMLLDGSYIHRKEYQLPLDFWGAYRTRRFEIEDFNTKDVSIKAGIVYFLISNFYIRAAYQRGLMPVRDDVSVELYNQAITITVGYQLQLKK